MKRLLNYVLFVGTITISLLGCTRSDEYYGDYLKQGEVYYPGRIDSLSIIPGDRRAILRFRMTTDPKISFFKAFVRNSLSSNQTVLRFPVAATDYGKIKEYPLDNLDESTYSIDIRTYASDTDSSRAVTTSQFIYGQSYANTLTNRSFLKFAAPDTIITVPSAVFAREPNLPRPGNFYPMQYTEVVYINTSGAEVSVKITPYEEFALLGNIKNPSTIKYRTVYKPMAAVIDFFYTPFKEAQYPK
ncbi:DUF4998 domain-containing protein [Niabella sp. CC-SYL272]|uniref:DUF4998 domain-containing protein n=1 Tax=Niabella agricola TaxID=2891571 RepID=UPI001F3F7D71|nr:DUF4998 domain-containing protein [Niabella agricola]MCF3110382.1 DUF4998 domain-containing protein [Niabella agricola]